MAARVTVFDTTLRDGEQAPGFSLRPEQKVRLAHELDALGVDAIEAGFPIASATDAEAVWRVATEVRRPIIAALARCRPEDIERAGHAVKPAARPRIHTFLATSDLHLARKLKISREDALRGITEGVTLARKFTDDVQFSAEDATRSDMDYLCRAVEAAIKCGATTINLPDTVGYATPDEIEAFFREIITRVPHGDHVVFSTHCHNDLGLAVANSLAALAGGARQVECTINGIGERAGNASLEEIAMILRVRHDRWPYQHEILGSRIYPVSALLVELTGEPVQSNKAIVGRNAFAHEAGIHQDGVLKDPRTYEIMKPEDVGVPRGHLVLGKHSGRHALQKRCTDLGFPLVPEELQAAYEKMLVLADTRRQITDADLHEIIRTVRQQAGHHAPMPAQLHPMFVDEFGLPEAGYGHGV